LNLYINASVCTIKMKIEAPAAASCET
jgi:hypothetical protein